MESIKHNVKVAQRYVVECIRKGKVVWTEEFDNLVVTAGRNKYLDATIKTGLTGPAWYVGLKGTGTPAAADTMASHATWAEINPYTGNRPAFTAGTIASGSVDNSAAKASYTITADLTVYGAFMADTATGATGTLLGAGDFAASRAVLTGDTLNVQITCSITAT